MTKKRICLLTQFFPPETSAAANRLYAMAEAIDDYYDLTVVTNNPGYPHPELYDMSSVAECDQARTYRIRRTIMFSPHAGSLIIRGMRESFMSFRMMLAALRERADIIMVSTPSMFLGPPGLLLSGLKRAGFIWDVRDITWRYPQEAVSAAWPVRITASIMERIMEFCLKRADLVTAATPGIRDVLLERGLSEDKVVMVLNGVSREFLQDTKELRPDQPKERYRVLYAGVLGYAQGLSSILDAAEELQHLNVDFVFAGDGPERKTMEEQARRKALMNVMFTGYLTKSDLINLYRQSDILLSQL
ncbi:MAG: glycosyltransferase family 4 protein, partial [Nitrospiraceae bacterium]